MGRKTAMIIGALGLLAALGVIVGEPGAQRGATPVRQPAEPGAIPPAAADGTTALEQAIIDDSYGTFLDLLRRGADPNAVGRDGSTAIHLAAQHRNRRYLERLLDHGGNPDSVARRLKRTPIFNALDSRRPDNRDLLIARGANIEHADSMGSRPLAHAAAINDFGSVWRLLQAGADPTATDNLGTTFQSSFFRTDPAIMSWEALRLRRKVVDLLEARGIPLDPKARRTP